MKKKDFLIHLKVSSPISDPDDDYYCYYYFKIYSFSFSF